MEEPGEAMPLVSVTFDLMIYFFIDQYFLKVICGGGKLWLVRHTVVNRWRGLCACKTRDIVYVLIYQFRIGNYLW